MKKFLMMVLAAAMVLPFAGCKEKTAAEKAQDVIEQAAKDVKKAAKDLTK